MKFDLNFCKTHNHHPPFTTQRTEKYNFIKEGNYIILSRLLGGAIRKAFV